MTARACPQCGEALPDSAGLASCPRCLRHVLPPRFPDLELDEGLKLSGLPPPPPPLRAVLVSSEQGLIAPRPAPVHATEWRRCLNCKARVRRSDAHCFLCGQPLHAVPAPAPPTVEPRRRDFEPHRSTLIGTLARVSLFGGGVSFLGIAFLPLAALSVPAAAAGIVGIVMARDDLDLMERQLMDPAGRDDTQAAQSHATVGIILAIAGTLLSLLVNVPSLLA